MCTLMTIKTKDNAWITGRTNEFEAAYESELFFVPREKELDSWVFKKTNFTWKNKYSFIRQDAKVLTNSNCNSIALDGLNEKGLSISVLYFHYHKFKEKEIEEVSENNIHILLLGSYILGNYKNIEQVKKDKEKLESIVYWDKGMSQKTLGFHLGIIDSSGEMVVIEPENEELVMKNSPLKILTNSSPLEFHYEGLRKYSHLSCMDIKPKQYKGLPNHKLMTVGNGLFGIPGDFTADSRFIRAAFFASNVEEPNTAFEGVNTLFRMLHTADIVQGVVGEEHTEESFLAFKKTFSSLIESKEVKNRVLSNTDNMLVKDLKNLKFFYKTHDNLTLRMIDLNKIKDHKEEKRIVINNDNVEKFFEIEL